MAGDQRVRESTLDAFGGQSKTIINNGEVNLLCDTGCGIYAPGTTGTQDNHNGTADIVIPDAIVAPTQGDIPAPPADPNAPQMLSNYIVGTNADGSSGTLKANNLMIGDDVKVNTGFTAGTAETTVVVDNAFTGSNYPGRGQYHLHQRGVERPGQHRRRRQR